MVAVAVHGQRAEVDDAPNAGVSSGLHQAARALDVDPPDLGGIGPIADQRGGVKDLFHTLDRAPQRAGVGHVPLHDLDAARPQRTRAIDVADKAAHVMPALDQRLGEAAAHEARGASNQCSHANSLSYVLLCVVPLNRCVSS